MGKSSYPLLKNLKQDRRRGNEVVVFTELMNHSNPFSYFILSSRKGYQRENPIKLDIYTRKRRTRREVYLCEFRPESWTKDLCSVDRNIKVTTQNYPCYVVTSTSFKSTVYEISTLCTTSVSRYGIGYKSKVNKVLDINLDFEIFFE